MDDTYIKGGCLMFSRRSLIAATAIDQTGTYSYRYIAAPTNPRNRAVQLYATYLFGKK